MALETGVSPETSSADLAIERRFRIVNSRDVVPQLPMRPRAKGTCVDETVIGFHMKERIAKFDHFPTDSTRLYRGRL